MKRLVLIILILSFHLIAVAEQPVKRVLYIRSYHPAFPTFSRQIEGVNSVFIKNDILLDIEFMDTKRFPDRENINSFHSLLSQKLRKLPSYDAVIAADDAALLYAIEHGRTLFKNTPVFFCGVNDIIIAASMEKGHIVRGVVEVVSINETLELIRRLFPERTRLAVIADGTIPGSSDLKKFITESEKFSFAIEILSLDDLTFEQLNSRLRGLNSQFTVLLLSAYTDSTGFTKSFDEGLSGISLNSNVPIFHLWEHGLGGGIFGGKLVYHYDQGYEAALMVLNYFDGTLVSKIKNINDSPNRYSFDYNQMEKFGISLSKIPHGSTVINKPLSFYENNKVVIIISGTIIFALLYLILILLIESRRLRRVIVSRTEELAESEEKWKFSLEGAGQIEEEVRKSRRMLQMVLDTIPIGVFWKDKDFTYLGCNNSFARLIGIESAGSIVGKRDIEVFDPEVAEMYNKTDREILNTGRPKLYYEEHLVLPTGKVRILRKSKVPLTGVDGEVIGVLGTYEDVTVQKTLREETFRIQKLESVGILASGIAHDFNNLLMAISGSLSVLRLSEDLTGKNLHWIENAEKSCFAATELTTRLITFSRGGAPVLQDENIVEVINEAVDSGSSGSQVSIDYLNESSVTGVMIDGRQVRQVLINLIENAKEAMPGGGNIYIVSSEINLESNNRLELKSGRYLMITVKDTGPGIPETNIDKIFDPYFSTKEMGPQKGQGLGLAISHSIITQHGGKITVSSVPGKGALFTIYIPFSL